jgi:ureidoacrylate peracid hydrolase
MVYPMTNHRPDGLDHAALLVDQDKDGLPRPEPMVTSPSRTIQGTWGGEVIDEIAPQPDDIVIRKFRWSAFHQTPLSLLLVRAGVDTLILSGGMTEVGVASTAYAARDRDFNLVVARDACRSAKAGINDLFMEKIFPFFARVMSVEEVIACLTPTAKR